MTQKQKQADGFTLIELIVVIVILGILASLIAPKVLKRADQALVVKAQQDIRAIDSALQLYRLDNHIYPSTAEGLKVLVVKPATVKSTTWQDGGYLKKIPKDPWGNHYIYVYPGEYGDFDLISLGADGSSGGQKNNRDITSWGID
ncbi:MAG: type II secretion system major pseudopilin GspG [Gammaproteobacteria bacterium]|nr:type II secretion system major pseudopilin GspG [Gammaproteobacteria bacterium]